jgi:aminomethyltransferase
MHRISTNNLTALAEGEGAPTLFTSPNARIIDRATVYHRGEKALVITEPGRGPALPNYLQRNIFFNDDARLMDITAATQQLDLHGPQTDTAVESLVPGAATLAPMHSRDAAIGGAAVFLARNKSISGSHWTIIAADTDFEAVWEAVAAAAKPAGSLAYNMLRIRAGRPGVGRELSQEYIPLEVGLWDEVSFHKGCYAGQEIIARMESRNRLARIMVRLTLDAPVNAPADLIADGRTVGTVTSSVVTADGSSVGIGVVKVAAAAPGQTLQVANSSTTALIRDYAGSPPPALAE